VTGLRTAAERLSPAGRACGRTAAPVGQTVGVHVRVSKVFYAAEGELAHLAGAAFGWAG